MISDAKKKPNRGEHRRCAAGLLPVEAAAAAAGVMMIAAAAERGAAPEGSSLREDWAIPRVLPPSRSHPPVTLARQCSPHPSLPLRHPRSAAAAASTSAPIRFAHCAGSAVQ